MMAPSAFGPWPIAPGQPPPRPTPVQGSGLLQPMPMYMPVQGMCQRPPHSHHPGANQVPYPGLATGACPAKHTSVYVGDDPIRMLVSKVCAKACTWGLVSATKHSYPFRSSTGAQSETVKPQTGKQPKIF